MDLYDLLESLRKQLDLSVKSLRKLGIEYAEAERNYRIALTEEILRLKDSGEKATILEVVAKGKSHIAKLRYERDCKEAIYKACQEAINSYKLQIKIVDNQISREYNDGSN